MEYKSHLEEQIEIIVVDGKKVKMKQNQYMLSPGNLSWNGKRRGTQMNYGKCCKKLKYNFLHADTDLPENIFKLLMKNLVMKYILQHSLKIW